MRKILWHSVAPWAPTGYGQQTALFSRRINALPDTDLAISATFGLDGSHMQWADGITIYPSDWNRTVHQWQKHHGGDDPCTVITLLDVWPLHIPLYQQVDRQGRLACWTPVDHAPAVPHVVEFLRESGAIPIAMSRFGEEQLREAGLDPLYVPHGVDTELLAPLDREEWRDVVNISPDQFVVGMVANNQGQALPRKAFSECFLAFGQFHEKHPDSILYLHTEMTGFRDGLDLYEMLSRFDIPLESVKVSDQILMEFGMPPMAMRGVYNTFDVLLNPSFGEGFGVPIVEAQACGVPVIVNNWTSMPELCGSGWIVDGHVFDHPMAGAFWKRPDVEQIVGALDEAYADDELGRVARRVKAREFALQYDADKVLDEYWVPVLEQIHKPREVKPIGPNRAQRRAAKKAGVAA